MVFDNIIVGTSGNDTLGGTSGRDLVLGLAGNDQIQGLGGHDCLDGGSGDDTLRGSEGDDVLVGGAGNDLLDGGDGNDKLFGKEGNDRLKGGQGNDALDGGPATDKCSGGSGANTITNCEPNPGPPGLQASFHHSTPTIELTWQPVEDAVSYNVYRANTSGGAYVLVGTSSTPSYADTAIEEGATYYYVVTAVDEEGFESMGSNEIRVAASLTTPSAPPPSLGVPEAEQPAPASLPKAGDAIADLMLRLSILGSLLIAVGSLLVALGLGGSVGRLR